MRIKDLMDNEYSSADNNNDVDERSRYLIDDSVKLFARAFRCECADGTFRVIVEMDLYVVLLHSNDYIGMGC